MATAPMPGKLCALVHVPDRRPNCADIGACTKMGVERQQLE